MSRSNWFSSRRSPSSRRTATRRRKPSQISRRRTSERLQLETLEERRVLAATVTTDLPDYAPGETAHILASEFAVGETVAFQVLHTDGVPNTGGGHEPWQVTDGVMGDFDGNGTMDGDLDGVADGNIHTTWYVNPDDSADSQFELTATGVTSGLSASHTFTDSVTFSGSGTVNSSSSSRTSATFSHTVGAGTDRLLLVTVLTQGGEDVSSITYGGVALTQAVERDFGDDEGTAVEIWYLKNATVGTANIVVSFASSVDPSYIRADNLTGVDQTTPIGATASNIGDDDDIAVNITTTTTNSLIFGAVAMHGGDTDPFSTGSGLTERFDSATGSSGDNDIGVWGAFRTTTTTGSYSVTAEADKSDDWTIAVVEIRMTQAVAEAPAINVVKRVNGNDANTAETGPTLAVGGTATFSYTVTNTGNVALSNVTVVDDNGTPGNPGDNFSPTFSGGDANSNNQLDLTETWTYSATRTVVANQYTNIATASGKSPANVTVTDTDPANYFGSAPALNIETSVSGQDADFTTGPLLTAGGTTTFTYVVTNTGNIAVGSISVVDNNGTPANAADDFNATYQSGDINSNGLLELAETWTYTANRAVIIGQFSNISRVNGSVSATGQTASDTDPTNYFGRTNPTVSTLSITSPIDENSAATLSGTYAHDGLFSSHSLDIDWNGDGTYDETVTVSGGSFSVDHTYLDDSPTATSSDTNGVGVRLRDAGGGSDIDSVNVTVKNVAPVIRTLSITSPINEAGSATLSGTYSDVGTLDTHKLDIDWNGDGTFDQTIDVSGGSFSVGRQYDDDDPTGTASDAFNVNVRLRDDDTGSDTDSVSLTVSNLAPEIQSLSVGGPISENESATLSGTYTDVGTLDTHELDIDWNGDGAYDQTITVIGGIFSIGHQYDDDNPTGTQSDTFSVNVRLRDDDTGSDTGSAKLTVNNVVPDIHTLSIASPIFVNDTATLSGTYSDVGPLDTHLLDIDWDGNGSYDETVAVAGGSFAVSHTFTSPGNFGVNTRLRDDDNGSYTGSLDLVVRSRPIIVLAPDKGNSAKPIVKVVNPETGKIVSQFYAYEGKFLGGVQVATGDMTGDGIDEIIVAPGQGRVGEVRVFTQQGVELTQFRVQPYGGKYTGGIEVAVGDVDGDGDNDIVTATKYGRPDIRVFYNNYDSGQPWADAIADWPNEQFYAFAGNFKGGADVIVADMGTFYDGYTLDAYTPDGRAEIIVANGPGMVSTIHVVDVSHGPKTVDTILPFHSKFKGGITLSAARVNGDLIPDLIVAAGNGGGSAVEIWDGLTNDWDARLAAFNAFGDQSTKNAPVHATTIDKNGDGIVDILAVVQGTNGKSNQIRYFDTYGSLEEIQHGFTGPWNIASLENVDPSLPLDSKYDVAAKDDVYTLIGTTTTAKKKKK